jgi:hypothetical protein
MAASGFTPIQLYYSTTATNVPLAANLLAGELAINTADGKVYYKNTSGVVTLLAGISGYSGLSGYSGYSGFSGYSGSGISGYSGSGVSGYSGFSGISGYSGTSGFSGASGISGYSGLGVSGFSGFSGFSGAGGGSGTAGASGYSGFSGISGYSGANGSTGTSGFSGFSGATGANGTNGTSGYSGFSGASGISGYSGATGPTTYPSTGIAVSTGSAWGTSLPDPLQVTHGGTGLSSVTAGYVTFGNSTTQLGSNANLFWSTANTRLGVGTNTPVATAHVRGGNSNNFIVDNDGSQYTTLSWYNNGTVRAQGYYDASNLLFVFGTDVAAPFIMKTNGTERMRINSGAAKVSIGTASTPISLLVNATDAIGVPVGTAAQRPTASTGYLRFNSDISLFEGYNGSSWGGVANIYAGGVVYENGQTISSNYTMTTGNNGMSSGPVTVATGVTVTIPNGSRWVIV